MKVLTYGALSTILLLGACSTSSGPAGSSGATAPSPPATTAPVSTAPDVSGSPTSDPSPTAVGTTRCGDDGGTTPHAFALRVDGHTQPAAYFGSGRDAAVLLHQTNGDGACGWFPIAGMIAAQGVRVVAFDLCGYGAATCPTTTSPARQVRAAVRWARAHGAHRVTVVGASMGGSVALGTAHATKPDAVVDLSGPMSWTGVTGSAGAARGLDAPLLAAAADADPSSDATALRRAALSSPGIHRFVKSPDGHGVEMLTSYKNGKTGPTPLLRTVIRWIKGQYS